MDRQRKRELGRLIEREVNFQSDDEKERRGHDNYKKFVADRKKQRLKEQ